MYIKKCIFVGYYLRNEYKMKIDDNKRCLIDGFIYLGCFFYYKMENEVEVWMVILLSIVIVFDCIMVILLDFNWENNWLLILYNRNKYWKFVLRLSFNFYFYFVFLVCFGKLLLYRM